MKKISLFAVAFAFAQIAAADVYHCDVSSYARPDRPYANGVRTQCGSVDLDSNGGLGQNSAHFDCADLSLSIYNDKYAQLNLLKSGRKDWTQRSPSKSAFVEATDGGKLPAKFTLGLGDEQKVVLGANIDVSYYAVCQKK